MGKTEKKRKQKLYEKFLKKLIYGSGKLYKCYSSCGYDGISAYDDRLKTLIDMFNEGVFPEVLKIARMTPIFKKDAELIELITGLSRSPHVL